MPGYEGIKWVPRLNELLKEVMDRWDTLEGATRKRIEDMVARWIEGQKGEPDEAEIQKLLEGLAEAVEDKAIEELKAKLPKLIKDLSSTDADALARRLVDIVVGREELIPKQTEQQRLEVDDEEYAIWQRVRSMLYVSALAANGGGTVPTEPQARPHVFAAAAIQRNTTLDKVIKKDKDVQAQFCTLAAMAAKIEFREENPDLEVPVDLEALRQGKLSAWAVHSSIMVAVGH